MTIFGSGILCTVLLTSSFASGQADTVEVACDTTILKHHYTLKVTSPESNYAVYGNRDSRGRKHGWWCKPLMTDFLLEVCQYRHGTPTGTCYDNNLVTVHDRKGRVHRQFHVIADPPF